MALVAVAAIMTSCKKEAATETAVNSPVKTVAVKSAPQGKVETASFHIEGMSCAVMCAGKIQQELTAMNGVQKAAVDFDKKTATVEYDSAVLTPQQLAEKVESVADGKTYKVSAVKSSADHAMLIGDPVQKKADKKSKKGDKDAKSCSSSKEKKGGCCAAKKHCDKM